VYWDAGMMLVEIKNGKAIATILLSKRTKIIMSGIAKPGQRRQTQEQLYLLALDYLKTITEEHKIYLERG
jgi:hypothetical protein